MKARAVLSKAGLAKGVLAGAILLVAACNTAEGVGKDVSAAGTALSGAAAEAKSTDAVQPPDCDPAARYVRGPDGRLTVETLDGGTGKRPCSAEVEAR